MLMRTLYREHAQGFSAQVHATETGYVVRVINPAGTQINEIVAPGRTDKQAYALAEQALADIQTLNG